MKRWSDFTQPGGKAQQSQVIERVPFSLNIGQLYPEAPLCYNPRRIRFTASTQIPNLSPTLVSVFEHQDQQFSAAFSTAREAIANRAFPAACIAVTHAGKMVALKSFGKFVYEEDRNGTPPSSPLMQQGGDFDSQVRPDTLFDLASVTKAIATTTMAMILYERGLLELEAPVSGTIPEFLTDDERRHAVTFRMLLAHSSGLPAYEKLFLKTQSRDQLLQAAFTTPLTADPGTRAEYSDIGFIVLGVALERIAAESLDAFCQREIFGPLGMAKTTFNPPQALSGKIPPTADGREGRNSATAHSTFRNRIVQGEVQDENANVLGGVAAHAGLFSTAEDVARFAHMMLAGGNSILRPETIALFTRREASPSGTSHALGWDTPSVPSQSGRYFGPRSYGHLGYTGTSLWIDPDRQLSITLLTNRTWPDCANQAIK
jgi:CubicO group peptidase (beta-lactamase class C family)